MTYSARQGDIIWLTLDPQAGHEQKGRRPALVVSNNTFNSLAFNNGAMVCPITSKDKNYPLHMRLDTRTKTSGVIMCNQAKILDLRERDAVFIETAPEDIVAEAVDMINGLIEIEK
jgi:mRNA interferase MazF